jgi:4-hydroxybenzoate polyprenyltransferase
MLEGCAALAIGVRVVPELQLIVFMNEIEVMSDVLTARAVSSAEAQDISDAVECTSIEISRARGWLAYASIARPDHWFKNVFMLLGTVLAFFYHPELFTAGVLVSVLTGLAATCLIASSNYVLNEILDAPTDLAHPVKRFRPIPSGQVNLAWAYVEWLLLAIAGLGLAWTVNQHFLYSGAFLWIMGLVYNVPPVRSKEHAYVDVLSESVNNPLRLLLGWFAVSQSEIPPVSLLASYWMVGAFFMATKRFAEYRSIAHISNAAAYRSSFRHYDENKLLVSMFFYATASALFLGVFIIRYHLELILGIPLLAGFFSSYMWVALKPNSATQNPERLYREHGLMVYLVVCVLACIGLMFLRLPFMYELFNVEPSTVPALWEF